MVEAVALRRKALLKSWVRKPWFGPLVALLGVYALFALLTPETFLGNVNLTTMARQTAVVGLAAVGMTVIMVQGGIDLSVGSSVALTTVVLARALEAGAAPLVAAVLAVALATVAGALNGLLVNGLKVTPFIATLGTMSILRGTAKGIADEQKIDAEPAWLADLMATLPRPWDVLLFPPGVWMTLIVALLVAAFLNHTLPGRHIVATGSNPVAAKLCGVPVERVTLGVYIIGGSLAGLAGVLEFATLTVGDPTDSMGLELEVIAAVVIGGGSLSGGQGSVLGTLLGALLLTVIKTGCTHIGLPNWVQEILTGGIIVVAMGLDRLRSRQRG